MRRSLIWLAGLAALASCRPAALTERATTAAPTAELRNTRWVLRQLQGQPVPPTNDEPYVLLRATEPSAEGNGSCNRFRGPFQLPAAGQLRFGPLLATRMACPALATETAFLAALESTRTYRISGDTLQLFGEGQTQPAAVLWAVYLR